MFFTENMWLYFLYGIVLDVVWWLCVTQRFCFLNMIKIYVCFSIMMKVVTQEIAFLSCQEIVGREFVPTVCWKITLVPASFRQVVLGSFRNQTNLPAPCQNDTKTTAGTSPEPDQPAGTLPETTQPAGTLPE